MPDGAQGGFGDFADAGNSPDAERLEECGFGSGGNPHEAAGFGLVGGDFCHQARAGQAHRAGKICCVPDFAAQLVRGGERRTVQALRAGEIEIGFVHRGHLDDGRIARENFGDTVAPFRIEVMARL